MAIVIRILDRPSLGALTLDCTIREEHSLENEITDSPVELGADVTDHIRNLPQSLTLEGVVTPTPDIIGPGAAFRASTAHLDAWQTLREIWRRRDRFNVTTSLRKYRNMTIQSVSAPRSLERSNVLVFTANLREILFASVELSVALAADTEGLGSGADNLGTQGLKEIPALEG